MKLQNFLEHASEFINEHKERITQYAEQLKTAGGYNDFDLRLAFDCFYYHKHEITKQKRQAGKQDFYFSDWICELCNLDKRQGINDAYISTLYKKALKDCGIL